MAVLLSLHKSIFTLLARNRPVYCKVRYERKADIHVSIPAKKPSDREGRYLIQACFCLTVFSMSE